MWRGAWIGYCNTNERKVGNRKEYHFVAICERAPMSGITECND